MEPMWLTISGKWENKVKIHFQNGLQFSQILLRSTCYLKYARANVAYNNWWMKIQIRSTFIRDYS